MSKTVTQSTLINKLKAKAKGSWSDAREVAPKPRGMVQLPSGIIGGVARVTGYEFKETEDKGKGSCPMVQLKCIVREPLDYEGVQQNIFYFFKDTEKRTVADYLEDFSNDIQLLGIETSGTDIDDIPKLLDQLVANKPYFKYGTWKGRPTKDFPDPQTKLQIEGIMPDYQPEGDEPATVPAEPETTENAPKPPPRKPAAKKPAATAATPAPRKGPPAKKPAAAAVVEPEEIEELTEIEDVPPEPEVSAKPKAGDRYYVSVKGEMRVCEVESADDDAETCICVDEDGGKKYKVTYEKIEADNQE